MAKPARGLGKGLDALLPPAGPPPLAEASTDHKRWLVPIAELFPRPDQPRKDFDSPDAVAELEGLAQTIGALGIIQPICVRPRVAGDGWEILDGERRWRAAKLAGLAEVPCVIGQEGEDPDEIALVANAQRRDLNPIEQARTMKRLLDEHGYTQARLGLRLGMPESTISNRIRLLTLPQGVREAVAAGALGIGQAQALAALRDTATIEAISQETIEKGLTTRTVENRVRHAQHGKQDRRSKSTKKKSVATKDLELRLQRKLGVRVEVRMRSDEAGDVVIHCATLDDFDRLIQAVGL